MLNTTVERKYNFDKVIAHTSFLGHTGYNNHSREFFTALNNLIPTRIRNFTHTPSINYLTQIQKDMIIKQTWKQAPFSVGTPYSPNDSENIINIILNESHHYYFYDKYKGPKIAYNVWESTRQIDEFFNQLLTYDQLWVPTKWQRDSTIEQGYPENKIKIVPEGVDGNIFKPGTQIDPNPKYIKNDRFSFMIFGRWDYRKSIGEMIQAFLNTFKKEEPVDLIISVDNPFSVDNMQSTEERLHHWRLEDSRIKILHFPPFSVYVKYLQQGNVFLSCSRAEGWNLPLIEAIACGTVSICSNYGAQLDFADNIANKVNIKDFIEPTDFFLNDTGKIPGIWAEPDFDHLEYVMRDVYENYSNLKSKAIEGSKQVRKKFTWENAANIAYKHLEELPSIKSISNPEVLLSVPVKETNIPYKEINTDYLNILITINHLNTFRGSELFTYTLAERLVNEGHKVTIYTIEEKDNNDTRFIDMFEDIGVSIFYNINNLYNNNKKFDVIHIQHNSTVKDVCKLFPDTPKVFFSHGVLPELEQPPTNFKIDKYIACSEEVKKNLENKGCKNVSIIRNLIDTKIFNPGEILLNDTCKKALVVSNYIKEIQKNIIIESCKKLNIEVKFIGGANKLTPNELALEIQQVDIVFSLGRGVMESMLCGRIPIVYDYNGGDGIVTPDNIKYLMRKNFSGRTNKIFYNIPKLITVIKEYKKEYGNILREIALEYFNYNTNTDKIIDIYKQTIDKIYGEVFVIGCHANTEEKLKLLKENINKIKELNIPIVITTHYPIPIEIQKQVDFVLYEKENILSGDNKLRYWFHSPDYVKIVGDCEKGNYQSVAIISLIRNAINFCKSYSYIHYLESDTIINIPEYLTKVRRGFKNQKKCVFFNYQDTISFITNIFSFNIEWFDKVFDKINSWEEYLQVDVDRAKSLDRKGNWVFESWMHTLFEAKDLYKDTLLLNNLDRDNIIIKNNVIDRGNEESLLRAFLAETNNNKVVLFIINDSNNNETWEIYKDNKLHIEQELPPHNVTWALWDKVNTNFTIKFKSKSILDLNLSIESTKIYDNTSFKFFDNTDIKALDWVWGDKDKDKDKINFNFIKGCFLELLGKERDHIFNYQIIDNDTSKVIYEDTLFINHHIKCSIEYYVDYLLKITNIKTKKVIFEHKFNLIGKRVLIEFDSKALGDSIAWIPYVEEFRVKHECTIFVSTFHNNLFKNEYPELNFVKPGTVINNLYAQYVLGCFEPADETNRSPFDYRSIPLQKIATSILGLDFKEIKPKIHIPKNINNFKSKYVCIAIHSTSQAKYWNNSKGWQKVVDYLHSINYKVVLLSKENAKYMNNKPPLGIIKKTGDSYSIEDRITDLYYADFFIGLSSGLSWLAWAIGTSVILISGHSKPWYEPQTDITRIYNPKVCSGCFNETNVIFDKGDWNWCLCNKKFECTKSISSEMVIDAIDNIIAK